MSCIENFQVLTLIVVVFLAGPALAGGDMEEAPTAPVRLLTIEGPLASPRAEVSGMTWQGDTLVILPQYPDRFADEGMLGIFALRKQAILEALDADDPAPQVQQWPAGIARVDCSIGLYGLSDEPTVVRALDHSAQGADDPGGQRLLQAKWIADGHHELPHAQPVRLANRQRAQPPAASL